MFRFSLPSRLASVMALLSGTTSWAAHPSQGLWVGEVSLNAVNEATGAVGDSNTYEFRDPKVPTPTSDTAFLRLILHVNGAGQVSLLKSVAIVERSALPGGATDLLLITDPGLYPQVPGIAKRIATAFYDFGDQQAVTAVQTLIDSATSTAVAGLATGKTQTQLEAEVQAALLPVVNGADVNAAYLNRTTGAASFITTHFFDEAAVRTIANEVARLIHVGTKRPADFIPSPASGTYLPFPADPLNGNFATLVQRAVSLQDASFYKDTRGLDAISGVVLAAASAVEATDAAAPLATKQANARSAAEAARHNAADLTQAYNRFIAGSAFEGLRTAVPGPAAAAAIAEHGRGRPKTEIAGAVRLALLDQAPVAAALTAAVTLKSASLWGDPRAESAVNRILDRAADAAAAQVILSSAAPAVTAAVTAAVADAMDSIRAAPVFPSAPSADYTGFVKASDYQAAATTAAKTAAAEVFFQWKAGVTGNAELTFLTQRAVNRALTAARNRAAALPQSSIPFSGSLQVGGALNGTIHLPALAPTNPFLHRRHPDHTEGFPITRRISLTVDAPPPGDSGLAGYGVSRISGTYAEELFGLHKPLGSNQDVGLRTQGTFTLNRLTFVDTLNF